jgi:hypothetical protein
MEGVFYTTKYLVTVNGKEYEFDGREISYAKRLPSEFSVNFTKEKLKNAIDNGFLYLQLYKSVFQGTPIRTYLTPYSRVLIGGIDITDVEDIEIKFTFKKIKCGYTINELKDKLTAEEYIDMVQVEGLNDKE